MINNSNNSSQDDEKMLIINVCNNELHYFEFIEPIIKILKKYNKKFSVKHFSQLNSKSNDELVKFDKIIISGTSLKDFEFLNKDFFFIKNFEKPILGICAGMQIICKTFNCEIISENSKDTKINQVHVGIQKIDLKDFLDHKSSIEVYCLHKNSILNNETFREQFIDCSNRLMHAIKHKTKPIFGVIFHPEVRNEDIIVKFITYR